MEFQLEMSIKELLLQHEITTVLEYLVEELREQSRVSRKFGDYGLEETYIEQAGIIERIIPEVESK